MCVLCHVSHPNIISCINSQNQTNLSQILYIKVSASGFCDNLNIKIVCKVFVLMPRYLMGKSICAKFKELSFTFSCHVYSSSRYNTTSLIQFIFHIWNILLRSSICLEAVDLLMCSGKPVSYLLTQHDKIILGKAMSRESIILNYVNLIP